MVSKKENTKNLILKAAKKLFVEEGFKSTSIRKIASEIGYSPTTIYLYYKDKNDIIYALHQEGFQLLKTKFTVLMNIESPFERLKAIGKTYLQFAKENADFYEVMFMMKEPMDFLNSTENEVWEDGKQTFNFIISTISECQKEGFFSKDNPEYVALQAWGFVHGLCSLYITTRLEKVGNMCVSQGYSDDLLEITFKTYVNFIEQNKNSYDFQ